MKNATRAVTGGRSSAKEARIVNPPLTRASTIVFPTYADLLAANATRSGDGLTYGLHGVTSTFELEAALRDLEIGDLDPAGYRTRLAQTGLMAVTLPMLAVLSPGDHCLLPDCVYGETRAFARRTLTRLGVEVDYYDPLLGAGIAALMRQTTRLVLVESPGSWTFEVQDVPAIAAAAHRAGALVMMDNTWATPLFFDAFGHGVDISMQALTKYVGGHADLLLGAVTASEEIYDRYLQPFWRDLGAGVSADDAWLALRGLRTMPTRLKHHEVAGLRVADWLHAHPGVADVIHPALPHDPGHALWQRDFTGAGSLFAFILPADRSSDAHVAALVDELRLFSMGFSWGGYESLILPTKPARARTATTWPRSGRPDGRVMRVYIGLEDPDDLIADLAGGLDRVLAVPAAAA
ncbi:MAG: cystathionine beta-lyase [Pseudomonadota bacterium]